MTFTQKEKEIYHCPHAGRAYDPLAVRRVLTLETRAAFGRLCEEARDANPVKAANAQTALIAAARKAFSLPPIAADGAGVLDSIVWEGLIAYTQWLAGKGPRAKRTPASAPCTDCPQED